MSKKKILLTVMALVLVSALSVMGTMAYLQTSTVDPVVNTFVYSGTEPDFVKALSLDEYKITQDEKGVYTKSTKTVKANTYKVLPGTTLPKHAFVTVTEKNTAPAYLYLEVVGTLDDVYTWSVDAANWTLLSGVTGAKGGAVYVYKDGTVVADVESLVVDVLTDNQITVDKDATAADLAQAQLSFYAYLAQATVGTSSDAATVYTTCFPYTAAP